MIKENNKFTKDYTINKLLENYHQNKKIGESDILKFEGVPGKDVYNPTAPFLDNGKEYIAGRVESRDSEMDSQIMFFSEKNGGWHLNKNLPVFELQDPFVTRIHDYLILCGVKTIWEKPGGKLLNFMTVFYKGKDIKSLEYIAKGPDRMKDIRLIELPDKNIGIFTRPQGKIGGKGKIGYMTISSLGELGNAKLLDAPLLEKLFPENAWGGVNEIHIIDEEHLGVLGHLSYSEPLRKDKEIKHYYAITFNFNYKTKKASPIKIIATRSDFPEGPAKPHHKYNLQDILFTGGLILKDNGSAELFTGLSDVNCGRIVIPNPFIE